MVVAGAVNDPRIGAPTDMVPVTVVGVIVMSGLPAPPNRRSRDIVYRLTG
jgi:hypothetical protein